MLVILRVAKPPYFAAAASSSNAFSFASTQRAHRCFPRPLFRCPFEKSVGGFIFLQALHSSGSPPSSALLPPPPPDFAFAAAAARSFASTTAMQALHFIFADSSARFFSNDRFENSAAISRLRPHALQSYDPACHADIYIYIYI